MALLVITIHTDPLTSYNTVDNFILTRIVARTAVPFFFICSGYFFSIKTTDDIKINNNMLYKYVKKIGLLYLVSMIIYLPINLYNHYFEKGLTIELIKDILFNGTFYHLWYLPALMIGMSIVFILLNKLSIYRIFMITVGLYIIGLLGDSYYGIAENILVLKLFYEKLFLIFDYTRNGILFAPIFIIIGAIIAKNEKEYSYKSKILFIIWTILFSVEVFLLKMYDSPKHDSMTIFLVTVIYYIFIFCLSKKGSGSAYLRSISQWIYILHPMIIVVVRGIGKVLGLTDIIVENSLIHYIFVSITSISVSIVLIYAVRYFKTINKNIKKINNSKI